MESSDIWKWWYPPQELSDSENGILSRIRLFHLAPFSLLLQANLSYSRHWFSGSFFLRFLFVAAWRYWFWTLPRCSAFASDAFKINLKTSIPATGVHTNTSVANLVPYANTVFTAEALAIHLALMSLLVTHSHILILTDRLSVLRVTEAWSFKSTKTIFQLLNTIYNLNKSGI